MRPEFGPAQLGGRRANGAGAVPPALGRLGRQAGQHIAEVGEGVDAQVLAGRREAEEHRRGLAALVAADEQPVARPMPISFSVRSEILLSMCRSPSVV